MMFLAHFTGTDMQMILNWPVRKILFWYNEAAKLHNKLKPPVERE